MALLVCLLAADLLAAQAPRISVIDFYGLRRLSEGRLRQALAVKEGDPLPPSKADVEERLTELDGLVLARVEAVCCEAGGAMLFVGIEEKGAPHFDVHAPPSSSVTLPDEVVSTYRAFLDRFEESARSGEDRESYRLGYRLSADAGVRAYQEQFVAVAKENLPVIREVLRESVDAEQRMMAAYLIGYAPDRQAAVDALEYALRDPEEPVRRTALGALTAIAVHAAANPDAGVRISPTWASEMLNSVNWGDRTNAARFLVTLSEGRNQAVLQLLRERALVPLVEMAGWNSLAHALPAYVLVGRIAGLSEEQIQETWSKGERDALLSKFSSRRRPAR